MQKDSQKEFYCLEKIDSNSTPCSFISLGECIDFGFFSV